MPEDELHEAARRILDDWDRPSPMSEAVERAVLDAPMPWPDTGAPTYSEPAGGIDPAGRSEPDAYVTLDESGRIIGRRDKGLDY